MNETLTFRPAQPADGQHGTALMLETLYEYGVHLFGFGDAVRAQAALAQFFVLPANRFSFQFVTLVETGGGIAGLISLFDRKQMRRAMEATALHMWKVYSFKDIGKFLKLMLPYYEEEKLDADELYIAHLAVDARFRRRGYALQMLAYAEGQARAQGKRRLTLFTEIENTPAQALYRKFGLEITATLRHPESMRYLGSEGDIRMEKPLV